jgi:uncharacterized protein YybS (DUF2232 family)
MKLKDVLGCAGGVAFFLFASAGIPFAGPFLSLLTPLPFLYYSTKLGFYAGVKLAALAIFIVALMAKWAGYPQIILFGLEFGLLGLALAELLRRKLTIGKTILLGTACMVLVGLGVLSFAALLRHMGPMEMMRGYFEGQLKGTLKAYQEMGVPQERMSQLEAFGKAFTDIISRIYPSLMIIGSGFAVWLNVLVAGPLARMGHLDYPEFAPLDRWRTPDGLVWGVIASGFALFLFSGEVHFLAINTLIILMTIYLFHGLSIFVFFLNKYHVPSWIRIGIYFLIVIQQLFLGVLALAGLFDQWVDFRRIHRRQKA